MSENTVLLYKCSKCERVLLKPADGLVVHGNIYVADPTAITSLIGDNFPTKNTSHFGEAHTVVPGFINDAVTETVLCVHCFLKTCLPNTKITTVR